MKEIVEKVKAELEEEKRKSIESYVKSKLNDIARYEKSIADYDKLKKEAEAEIAEIEKGNYDKALKNVYTISPSSFLNASCGYDSGYQFLASRASFIPNIPRRDW